MSDLAKSKPDENGVDIEARRLEPTEYEKNFCDVLTPLDRNTAVREANHCLFCYDAPCIDACPTSIDIPSFIQKISTDNVKGAAKTILEQNIMGGGCARVCPVEELCESACVRKTQSNDPVKIGQLQRYATDHLFARDDAQLFERKASTGKRIAVIGAGPAGLSCAHNLSREGHDVVIFEARPKSGGLNEYGIAAYKMANDFAQKEVDYILSLGGIEIRHDHALGQQITLDGLRAEYDAVFLGMGMGGVNALGLENEGLEGIGNAVDYIASLRQADDKASLPVGRRVVVIGGGNTAIDMAIQIKRLGAEDVTLVYRRGTDEMGATDHEQEFAQTNDVRIKLWAKPRKLIGDNGHISAIEFEYTKLDGSGRLIGTGEFYTLEADMVFKAIGQNFDAAPLNGTLDISAKGKIAVNDDGQTTLNDVWAGGDCTEGADLTVVAVEDGKKAAASINTYLSA
jgi:dihydropyrimidine dehydrogenase (NAD+) subunit PreT